MGLSELEGVNVSVLDDLQGLEKRVRDRMRELRPMLAEYQELEKAAKRLGIDVGDGDATERREQPGERRSPRASRTQQRVRPSRRAGSRAPAGSRREQLLSLVNQQPGITVREAGQKLGVDGTSLYRVVRRLQEEGAVQKEGTHLQPMQPGGATSERPS